MQSTNRIVGSLVFSVCIAGCDGDPIGLEHLCSDSIAGRCWTYLGLEGVHIQAVGAWEGNVWVGTYDEGLWQYDGRSGAWRPRGFDGKAVTSIAFVPQTSRMWIAVAPLGADTVEAVAYYSDDAGESWSAGDGGLGETAEFHRSGWDVVADPTDPERLFIGLAAQIVRSEDGGRTWDYVYGNDNLLGLGVTTLAYSRVTSATMWAGGAGGLEKPILLRSSDAGDTWEFRPTGPASQLTGRVTGIVPDAIGAGDVAISVGNGVLYSPDGGQSWTVSLTTGGAVADIAWADPEIVAALVLPGPGGRSRLGIAKGDLGAQVWELLAAPEDASGATCVVIDARGNLIIGTRSGVWLMR